MYRLKESNIRLLFEIQKHEEGATAKTVADGIGLPVNVVANRLSRMKGNGLLECKIGFYKLTQAGAHELSGISRRDPESVSGNVSINQTKRGHALQANYTLWASEYPKLEVKLAAAGIRFKRVRTHGYVQVEVIDVPEGIDRLRFTTRKMIAYGPQVEKPFEWEGRVLKAEALSKNILVALAFIEKTGIRLLEENGKLKVQAPYFEIGHTNDGTAQELTKRPGKIPLAWDKKTGKLVSWADRSVDPRELEFNDLDLEKKVSDWLQALKDGRIDPVKDPEKLRTAIADIFSIVSKQTEFNDSALKRFEMHEKLLKERGSDS